ncbi:MAG: ribosomal protein S18-alanine N-acetyltransferase [Oscillospiraceae bacterium]|nr:ribosomal protein S18-alanine N-acetyltransferase [Oscillospiraceae bacterium]
MMNLDNLHKLELDCFRSPWTRGMLTAELTSPLSVAVYEYVEEELAAFAFGRVVADEAELFQIGTRSDLRGRGIAKRLLERFHEEARKKGAAMCFLEVRTKNAAAISLYKKAGYERVSVRENYYPDDDALVMRKEL